MKEHCLSYLRACWLRRWRDLNLKRLRCYISRRQKIYWCRRESKCRCLILMSSIRNIKWEHVRINVFLKLFDDFIRIYIFSYLDLQSYIFKLFDSKMKIVRDENQHNNLEKNSVVVHSDKIKNSSTSTIIDFYRISNAFWLEIEIISNLIYIWIVEEIELVSRTLLDRQRRANC